MRNAPKGFLIALFVLALISGCVQERLSTEDVSELSVSELKPGEVRGQILTDIKFKTIQFSIKVPEDTGISDKLFLSFVGPAHDTPYRIQLDRYFDGYAGEVELPVGALIRYKYETSREEGGWGQGDKEAFSEEIPLYFRYLYVSPELTKVEDTIAMWEDKSSNYKRGAVKGRVTDRTTGKPIMDAFVSVAGLHLVTDYNGKFELENIPEGRQNILVQTALGDYRYGHANVEVREGSTEEIDFELEPAKMVRVTFSLEMPEDAAKEMPDWAIPKIVGSIYQLGATRWQRNELEWKVPDRHVPMKKTGDKKFTASVDLYEGMYVDYTYYLGTNEKNPLNGLGIVRAFIVNASNPVRNDVLVSWKEKNVDSRVVFIVDVPPNTPKTDRIFVDAGGAISMGKISAGKHGLVMYHPEKYGLTYAYAHGISYIGLQGWEATKGDKQIHPRNFTVGGVALEKNENVERWRLYPESSMVPDDKSRTVKFTVAAPSNTPSQDKIYITGNVPELGNNVEAVEMEKISDVLWEKEIVFSSFKQAEYQYTRGDASKASDKKEISAEYDGQAVIDSVNSWKDLPFAYQDKIIGVQLNDYWTPNFLDLLQSTLDRLQARNIKWIDFPVIWQYTKIGSKVRLSPIDPAQYAGNSVYPTQDVIAVVSEVKSRGMKIILEGFVLSDTDAPLEEKINENEKYALYLAEIAKKTNADMLVLPAVSGTPNALVNGKMKELVRKVKQVYAGKIVINGFYPSTTDFELYDYPAEADYVAYNFFKDLNIADKSEKTFIGENNELVCCIYSSDAQVSELKAAIEQELENFEKANEKYGKPIIFTQIGFASFDGSTFRSGEGFAVDTFYPDLPWIKLDLAEQASLYEAFFQAIENKPWIEGIFSFGYTYTSFPSSKSFDVREKPAEAVLSKYASSVGGGA